MTQEEKQLLIKDLCSRLSYGVKVAKSNIIYPITGINIALGYVELAVSERISIEEARPYLRPMSSMTEEEFTYIKQRWVFTEKCRDENDIMDVLNRGCVEICDAYSFVEWLNAHHFDYRGLISMGLALPAPEGMYNL